MIILCTKFYVIIVQLLNEEGDMHIIEHLVHHDMPCDPNRASFAIIQEPQKIALGKPYYTDFSDRKRRKVQKTDHFYHVPLLDTLKTLLLNMDILSEVLNPHFAENNGELQDYCCTIPIQCFLLILILFK